MDSTVDIPTAASPGATRAPMPHGQKRILLPWIVLALGVPLSFFLFGAMKAAVDDLARARFERYASEARGSIGQRIEYYANVLHGLKALFASHDGIDRVEFHRYVDSLDLPRRYPGLEVVNFAAYVPGPQRQRFEDSVRADTSLDPNGYRSFSVRPPGERPGYLVVVFVEPMKGDDFTFGLDLLANPAVSDGDSRTLATFQHAARDSGQLTASGLPIRIRHDQGHVGLGMRLAVYRSGLPVKTVAQRRSAYLGSVGAGFNVMKLMAGAVDDEAARHVRFRLFDTGAFAEGAQRDAGAPERLLFDSRPEPAADAAPPPPQGMKFAQVLPIEVGGRRWEIHFSAQKDDPLERFDTLLPWVILVGGIVSSALLCGVLYSLASSRSRALAMAEDITRDLSLSEASLAQAQRMAHLGNWLYEPATDLMAWSAETYRIFGLEPHPGTVPLAEFLQRVHPEDRARVQAALAGTSDARQLRDIEHRILAGDGTVRWVHTLVEGTAGGDGAPARGTVMDITGQKRTEDALRGLAGQLTALSRRLVDVQEAERRQLSRELHDRVGQNLTALSINLDILETALSDDIEPAHRARLADSAALLESTVDSIEDVMAELRPPMLDDYGLFAALHWYARGFSERTGIGVAVLGAEGSERPRPEIEITLFRIAQEALTNVAKHSHARRAQIELDYSDGRCLMTITDDGIGIGTARADGRERHGLGMVTMRERSQAVGGRFQVRNAPGAGTLIAIEIPGHGDTHTHRG